MNLSGSGTAVSLSTDSLFFGDQTVGTVSDAQSVTLTNSSSSTLKISGIDASGDFIQNNDCGNSLAGNSSCTINVHFAPSQTGILTGELTITDDDPTSPQKVLLSGHGTEPVVSLSPTSLNFGEQGATGPAQTVTLSNIGNGELTIQSILVSGPFAQTNTCGAQLAAGTSCTIDVSFLPTQPGPASGTLTITDDAAGSPREVSLSGFGILPLVSLDTTSLTFPSTPIGTTSAPQGVSLTNTGTADLVISNITISGDFAQTNTCPATIPPTGSCSFTVTFSPTDGGTRTGALTITNNAAGSPHIVSLTGTGGDFALSAAPASASVSAGGTATYTLTVNPLFGFNGRVDLGCSGVPTGASCSVTPNALTLDGTNPSSATVTVTTTARVMLPPGGLPELPPPFRVPWLPAVAAFVILAALALRARRRTGWVLTAVFLAVTVWSACGAGGTKVGVPSGTPAGTVTLTLTGTSGSLTRTTSVTLTVN